MSDQFFGEHYIYSDTLQELEPKPGKRCCRCNPKDVIDAINLMSGPQKEKIRDLGWGKILDITIDAVKRRELFKWLLTKVDVLSMEIRVPPHTILPITKHARNMQSTLSSVSQLAQGPHPTIHTKK